MFMCKSSLSVTVAVALLGLLGQGHAAAANQPGSSGYDVTAARLQQTPVVSRANSVFDYSYNPAAFEYGGEQYLLVRTQNFNASVGPYAVGPSRLALSKLSSPTDLGEVANIVFEPTEAFEKCGTEDPRIIQRDGTTYLFYTAYDCSKAALSLATTTNPTDPEGWTRHGPLFPQLKWSKSGAAIIRKSGPHYLFFGDSTLVPGLRIATSTDLIRWELVPDRLLIETRKTMFDSQLVEGGPPPLQLSDGNYLFVYNSARAGFPSPKPGYDYQYNPGFVILNGTDPTQVLQRAATPLMTPTLPWETGNKTVAPVYLTPHVIFVEACFPVSGAVDTFDFYYGAADTDIGVARVVVKQASP